MTDHSRSERRFIPFFRRYTKTWIHAVATAGLTAFGTLTFVNRGFAVVAVAIYVLPPVVLYLRGANPGIEGERTSPEHSDRGATEPGTAGRDTETGRGAGETRDEPDVCDGKSAPESESAEQFDSPKEAEPPAWTRASTPDAGTLFDVVVTDDSAYAVGENGIVLRGRATEDWELALEDGPGANAADLHGIDATADGAGVWVAGDSGALGRFDAETSRHTDYSAPSDITDNWTAIAVSGTGDDETILLANGSGQVLRGRYRNGELAWDSPAKPGSGSSICAATLVDGSVGYLCDTNDGVFETTDGGERFERIGIDDVNGTLTDVAVVERKNDGRPSVTADDGVCYRYASGTWTPNRLGDEELRAISMTDGLAVVCGENAVFERQDGNEWERIVTPASGELRGVAVGADRAVAVGAGGTVVERNRR